MRNDEVVDENEDTQAGKYLTFILGAESYGLEMRAVTEIIGMQKITPVPDMPPFVRGVINLRGQVIPVMDVRARFRMPARDYDDRTCIIVIQVVTITVGLIVDTVSEVLDIPDGQIETPPRLGGEGTSRFIKGLGKVGEDVKIILDADRLLHEQEIEALSGNSPIDATIPSVARS